MGRTSVVTRILAIAVCLTACAPTPPTAAVNNLFAQAVPFCRIMADPKQYVDREVLVIGIFADTPHSGMLYGEGCTNIVELHGSSNRPGDKRAASILGGAFQKDIGARVEVVMRGVWRAHPKIVPCTEDSCMRYRLEDTQLLAAKRLR